MKPLRAALAAVVLVLVLASFVARPGVRGSISSGRLLGSSGASGASQLNIDVAAAAPGTSIVVAIAWESSSGVGSVRSCSDDAGNAYVIDVQAGVFAGAALCSSHAIAGAPSRVTVTFSLALTRAGATAFEYSGLAATGADRTASGAAAMRSMEVGPTASTSQADELLVAVFSTQVADTFTSGTNGSANACAGSGTPLYSAGPVFNSGRAFSQSCAVQAQAAYYARAGKTGLGMWTGVLATYRAAQDPDSDHDGVPDRLDRCPSTPSGQSVDENGCSDLQVDADLDGVCNPAAPSDGPSACSGDDACPTTPLAEDVDIAGCSVLQGVQRLSVLVQDAGLPAGAQAALHAPLRQAAALLGDAGAANDASACGRLGAFVNQVVALQRSGRLAASGAAPLLQAAAGTESLLGC